jgi:hypothetical protein
MITSELIQENYSDHVYICVLGVDFASFYDILELFQQCCIICFPFHSKKRKCPFCHRSSSLISTVDTMFYYFLYGRGGRRGYDRMVVEFTTTYPISA